MASYVSGSGSKAYIFGGVRNDFGVYMSELGLKNFTSKTYSLKVSLHEYYYHVPSLHFYIKLQMLVKLFYLST